MPNYYRDRRFGLAYAAAFTPVVITTAQMRDMLARWFLDVDAEVNSTLVSASTWIRTPDFDIWTAPDTTFNPTAQNSGAISNCKGTHRRG